MISNTYGNLIRGVLSKAVIKKNIRTLLRIENVENKINCCVYRLSFKMLVALCLNKV